MGSRGPIPRPSALKAAMGNPGKRRLNDHEPTPPKGTPDPPSFLVGKAAEIWREITPTLTHMDCLTVADRYALARYCRALARYIVLSEFFETNQTIYPVKGDDGKVRCWLELPTASEWRKLHELLLRLEQNFGLTPAARSRLSVNKADGAGASTPAAKQAHNAELQKFFQRGRASGTAG